MPKLLLLFQLSALAAHSVSSFHVGTLSSTMPKSCLLSRTMNKDNNNNNKMNFLSVRGGANHNRGALSAVMVEALSIVNNFYQTSPYVAAALTCGTKACAADYVAQKRAPASGNIDAARTIAFLVYGAIYQGMAQEFIYNHLYPLWFGTESTVVVVLKKVFFDLLIQTTLVTLPIAYLTKAAIYRHSPQQGLGRYWHDIWENGLLTKYFLLWGPVQCITFSIVPEHLRVSFIAVVSFFWLIVLSTVSARPQGNNNTEKVSVPRETVLPEDSSLVNER